MFSDKFKNKNYIFENTLSLELPKKIKWFEFSNKNYNNLYRLYGDNKLKKYSYFDLNLI